jgi:hypothetical protein
MNRDAVSAPHIASWVNCAAFHVGVNAPAGFDDFRIKIPAATSIYSYIGTPDVVTWPSSALPSYVFTV